MESDRQYVTVDGEEAVRYSPKHAMLLEARAEKERDALDRAKKERADDVSARARARNYQDLAELARIDLDTALSRVGKSDHDVRLCVQRAVDMLRVIPKTEAPAAEVRDRAEEAEAQIRTNEAKARAARGDDWRAQAEALRDAPYPFIDADLRAAAADGLKKASKLLGVLSRVLDDRE